MKSAEARDQMVARVHAAFAKWRTFEAMPLVREGVDISVPCEPKDSEAAYVQALHAVGAEGRILGRWGGSVVGKR